MNKFFHSLMVGTMLVAAVSATAVAADAPDSVIGTWTLNLDKSKFEPGPAPKSQTRTYAQTADGLAMTMAGVAADGTPISNKATYKYDGHDYPVSGSADYDTLSVTRINGTTAKGTQKKNGKIVGTAVRSVSARR